MTRSVQRVRAPKPVKPARRGGDARDEETTAPAAPTPVSRLGPAAAAGNRAVTSLLSGERAPAWAGPLAGRAVQRAPQAVGWKGATGWNKGVRLESGVNRVPIDGLTRGNKQDFGGTFTDGKGKVVDGRANEQDKTGESGAGRAVLLVPAGVSPDRPITVLLHLHGYTSRWYDPYAGWRERTKDGTVRDVALDKLEAQINAVGNPQIVGVLAQGVGRSEFGRMDVNAYLDEVLGRLVTAGATAKIPVPDPAKGYRLILSAHSGGGHTVKRVLDASAAGKAGAPAPAEVVLFEAINNAGEVKAVTTWATGHLDRTLAAVAQAQDDAGRDAAIAACPILRAYRSAKNGMYARTYRDLKTALDTWFADPAHQKALGSRLAALQDRFKVYVIQGTSDHEQVVGGVDKDPAAGPMADALSAFQDPRKASKLATGVAEKARKAGAPKAPARTQPVVKPAAGSGSATGSGGSRPTGFAAMIAAILAAFTAGAVKSPAAGGAAKAPATAKLPAGGARTGDATPSGFLHDLGRTTLERLPESDRQRFGAIEWVALDYPGAKMKVKDTSEENLEKWRNTPGIEVFNLGEKDPPNWHIRGTHQAEAQQLLDKLGAQRPGGGERRPNQGKTAILTSRQYKKDPEKYDEYISGQLADVTSYVLGSTTKTQTHQLNKHAAEQFAKVVEAAAADGVHFSINNSFRSRAKAKAGAARSGNSKAVASYSSHSMGLAVDLNLWVKGLGKRGGVSTDMTNIVKLLSTPGYKWMYDRGAEFGWYQYRNEPWHWEYNPPGFAATFWADDATLAPAEEPAKKGKK
jgi:hypothetical protein